MRAASTIRDGADSIEMAIVSPMRAGEIDGATQAIRALWPGRIRVVHVGGAADSLAPPAGVQVRADADDPIALAISVAGLAVSDSVVRVVRGAASDADSAWASGGRRTLVRWPIAATPSGWVARATPDTSGAVIAGEAALVTPLERRWRLDTTKAVTRVAARWVDGTPAAVERTIGSGCIRDVAIAVSESRRSRVARDVRTVRARARRSVPGSVRRTRGRQRLHSLALAGSGPLASHDAVRPPENVSTPLVPWLLAAAILLVLLELLVRRGSALMWSEIAEEPETDRRAGAVA